LASDNLVGQRYFWREKEEEDVMSDTALDAICEQLISAGWNLDEIERIHAFLRAYAPTDEDQSEDEIKHLGFLRYLVQTGRLVD
jgi:hypothetical protein